LKAAKWLNKLVQNKYRKKRVLNGLRHFALKRPPSARVDNSLLERHTRACSSAYAKGCDKRLDRLLQYQDLSNEQALVCLSNKEKTTRADVDHFIAKWRITVFFSNWFGLIYLAIKPPLQNYNGHWSTDPRVEGFVNFSETRACSSTAGISEICFFA